MKDFSKDVVHGTQVITGTLCEGKCSKRQSEAGNYLIGCWRAVPTTEGISFYAEMRTATGQFVEVKAGGHACEYWIRNGTVVDEFDESAAPKIFPVPQAGARVKITGFLVDRWTVFAESDNPALKNGFLKPQITFTDPLSQIKVSWLYRGGVAPVETTKPARSRGRKTV